MAQKPEIDIPPPIPEERAEIRSCSGYRAARMQRLIIMLRPAQKLPIWLRYILATGIVFGAFSLRYFCASLFPHPFLLFFPAVMLTTFVLDRGSGFWATALSAMLAWYFFVPYEHSFFLKEKGEIVSVIFFIFASSLASWAIEALRITVDELGESLEELRISKEQLQAKNEQLDEFAHIISHDLKEPIRGINHYAGFLEEDYRDKLDNEGKEQLTMLKNQAIRMAELIDTLLRYALIGKEKQFEVANLNEIIAGVLRSMEILLQENNTTVNLTGILPSVCCNKAHIGEVFRNLITNGIKYNDKPEKLIEIGHKREHNPDTRIELFVRDNGIGIPPKDQNAIFKMFKQLHPKNKFGGGTGSGLAIVRKIIEEHGGKIWVESVEGEGSIFRFYLDSQVCENRQAA